MDSRSSQEVLREIELELRGYIRYKLSSHDPEWWKTRVSPKIKTDCEGRKEKHESQWPWTTPAYLHPIEFANFNDYASIILQRENWKEIFQASFGDKVIFEGKLRELEQARNVIAHNRDFPEDAEKQFRANVAYLAKLIRSDDDFSGFKGIHAGDWEKFVESCTEEDAIRILAGNPWLLGELTFFRERNAPVGSKRIDLLFDNLQGRRVYAEVKLGQLNETQILEYAELLKQDILNRNVRLVWFVPENFRDRIERDLRPKLESVGVDTLYFDQDFFTAWSYLRTYASALLEDLHGELSQPFEYTVGRKGHPTFQHSFKNVSDALYFYGYAQRNGKRVKVGFHLATLGWYLDLLRNLSHPNFEYAKTNPELVVKLVLELLKYPYLYKDAKATKVQTYRPLGVVEKGGFIIHLKGYKKKGRIDDVKNMMISQCRRLTSFHSSSFTPFWRLLEGRYLLHDRALALMRCDILETVAVLLAQTKSQMNTLPAGKFRDGVIDHMGLEETTLTDKIGRGEYVAENTRLEDKGTYKANMGKRIVELMCMKRILDIHAYIVPTYEILVLTKDSQRIQGVQTFKLNTNLDIRRNLLGD